MRTLILIYFIIIATKLYSQEFTVFPDKRGYLAVDTSNNIWLQWSADYFKYDGTNWYAISNTCLKPYSGFIIDIHSNIWTVSGEYIYKYNESTGECKQYQWLIDTAPNQTFRKIISDKFGNLWFIIECEPSMNQPGTALLKIENDTVVLKAGWLWPESSGNMVADNNGDIWFATTETNLNQGRLYKYDSFADTLIRIYGGCGNPSAVDTSNHIWSGTGEFDGTSCISHNVAGSCLNDLGSFSIYSLVIDQNNIKWLGTSKGLIRFDGINCTVYDTTNSEIPKMSVSGLLIDKQNNLWFSSNDVGAGIFNKVRACGLIDTCITVVSPKVKTPSPKLKVYPNPTGNNIKISIPSQAKEAGVSIYNLSGSEVFKAKYKANEIEINTENFPKGVYLIKVNSGGEVFNEKVVIN